MTDQETVEAEGLEVVKPRLRPMTGAELQGILDLYPNAGRLQKVLSVSERPYSAASLIRTGRGDFFIKKRPTSWRRQEDLLREHALISHLVEKGFPTPPVISTDAGETVVRSGGWLYEVFARAEGEDLYRGTHSWSPFKQASHARSAGATLARFHQSVVDFPIRSARPTTPMSGQFELAREQDLIGAVERLSEQLPALGMYLRDKEWQKTVANAYVPFHSQVHKKLSGLPRSYTHGDWHGNNLFFRNGAVSAVVDFHLADFSYRLYDLCVALDRNSILWLEMAAGTCHAIRYDVIEAFLGGYQTRMQLTPSEKAVLPDMLAMHQLDLALTNIAYYSGVEKDKARADWAYDVYLLEHARFFATDWGEHLLDFLRERLR